MGFFNFIKGPDINQGIQDCQQTSGAVLLDVRTPQEYGAGHIPGSQNVPLQILDTSGTMTAPKDTPVFAYCYSGSRGWQAVRMLTRMGYSRAKNIGGITAYTGETER